MFNVKEFVLKTEKTQMDCIKFGCGSKPLVMIQGLNTNGIKGTGYPLAFMYRIFAKNYTVYLFDRRKDFPQDFTVECIADDIADGMDALGIESADVIGVSQGGMVAQYLAVNRPDLVEKLVLCLTLCRNNPTVERAVNGWIDMTQKKEFKKLVADMAEKMYSESYLRKYRIFMPLLTVVQKPKDIQRFCAVSRSCLTCDTFDMLCKIKCPVFVIGAEKDKIVTAGASTEIAEKLGCRLHIYKNLGHAAYEEAKDFNKIIYNFLTEK